VNDGRTTVEHNQSLDRIWKPICYCELEFDCDRVRLLYFSLIPNALGTLRAQFPSASLFISSISFFKLLRMLDTWLSCTQLRRVFSLTCKTIFSFWWRFSIMTYFYCPSLLAICRMLRSGSFGYFKITVVQSIVYILIISVCYLVAKILSNLSWPRHAMLIGYNIYQPLIALFLELKSSLCFFSVSKLSMHQISLKSVQ